MQKKNNESLDKKNQFEKSVKKSSFDTLSIVKKIFRYYKNYKFKLILSIIMAFLSSFASILGPKIVSSIVNEIQIGLVNKIDSHSILTLGIVLIVLYTTVLIISSIQGILLTGITQKVTSRLRNDIYEKLNMLTMKTIHSYQVGDVLSRLTNDVEMIGSRLSKSFVSFVSAITIFIGVLAVMLLTNVLLTITVFVSTIIGFIIISLILKNAQKCFEEQQKNLGNLNGFIEEAYGSSIIVKVFNKEEDLKRKFDVVNNILRKSGYKASYYTGVLQPLMTFAGNLGYVSVCVVGALLSINGKISFGVIISFLMYAAIFIEPLAAFGEMGQVIQLSSAAGKRVFEILEAEEMTSEEEITDKLENTVGRVEFDHVHFGYNVEDKIIINDFSVTIAPSQKIAIVGPTGAGKTTIINLMLRFYDIQSGEIRIDGKSIASLKRSNIRSQFCVVLQDTYIFKGTIRENLIYTTENVSEQLIENVCKSVGLNHLIRTLPYGYETILDDKTVLSDGQKQQIAIARAMIADRPMLILDEATSSVDTRLEILIQNAMDKLMEGRTTFVIAHRLSTIINADMILVLKDGDIIESGTHEALLARNGFYAELYESQFENV